MFWKVRPREEKLSADSAVCLQRINEWTETEENFRGKGDRKCTTWRRSLRSTCFLIKIICAIKKVHERHVEPKLNPHNTTTNDWGDPALFQIDVAECRIIVHLLAQMLNNRLTNCKIGCRQEVACI